MNQQAKHVVATSLTSFAGLVIATGFGIKDQPFSLPVALRAIKGILPGLAAQYL